MKEGRDGWGVGGGGGVDQFKKKNTLKKSNFIRIKLFHNILEQFEKEETILVIF